MRHCLTCFILLLLASNLWGQVSIHCAPTRTTEALSPRIANYKIDVNFTHEEHKVTGSEDITWHNVSPDTIYFVRLYMYLNAFKNSQSSYLSGAGLNVMGQDLSNRKPEDWGWVSVKKAVQQGGKDLTRAYVQPDDNNIHDESVLQIELDSPVLPGGILNLSLSFESKLPRTIARSGYGEHDFNHFVHWYPKMGVYEQDIDGNWGWNCHQFLRQMEFYGDHGNYDVTIESDQKFVLGGSGCRDIYKETLPEKDGRVVSRFIAHDVIDFGWVASPNLLEYEDTWEHVEIRLLSPAAHHNLVPRLLQAAKHSLSYFKEHLGEYPYNTLTILDPPLHGLRSGFMEYPTYITGGSFYAFPKGIRSMESLIVHEFSHQYFMQILANNEKEEPWLDEGFVTFYEDCIMEDAYGDASLADFLGYRVRNSAFTRNEYTSLPNPRVSPIAVPGWKVNDAYKGIIYSKTATILQTLKRYLGEEHFDEMMKEYFVKNQFTHPRKADFVEIVQKEFDRHQNVLSPVIDQFLIDVLDDTKVCDYAVTNITNSIAIKPTGWVNEDNKDTMTFQSYSRSDFFQSSARLERKGDLIVPLEIELKWSDGSTTQEVWDGIQTVFLLRYEKPVQLISVEIDPKRKLFLDIDFNNNSYTTEPSKGGIWKYAFRSIYWVQNAIQSTSFLM